MKTKSFESLQELVYSGQFAHKQIEVTSIVDYTYLSPVQTELYKRLLTGLSYYTPEQLYAMNSSKKSKIFKKHEQAQKVLNIWKQELTNKITNNLLSGLFPASQLVKDIIADNTTSNNYTNTLSFKDLCITKTDIINKFIEKNLLPHNFAAL
jgi:radical SAM superfamily enzyme with C-terminal helix-hairpin-helix motif